MGSIPRLQTRFLLAWHPSWGSCDGRSTAPPLPFPAAPLPVFFAVPVFSESFAPRLYLDPDQPDTLGYVGWATDLLEGADDSPPSP